ncbi:MAG: aminotransferase class III-fold pyridoxal phosphate-dependent enzyme, partial [Gaiellaceae bacterium]
MDERERFLIRYAGSFAPEPIARAEGAWIETASGRRILDFTSGQICSTLGHNHPRIAAAVQAALGEVAHHNSWMLSEPVLALAERLVGLFPEPLRRVMLLNTGSEANEVALKLAKMHTGRFEVVGLTRSFHGLLSGIASVNFSMAHAGYGPLLPGSFAIPAPYAYRCPVRHC